jgi:cell division septum initiation protein DivIVA
VTGSNQIAAGEADAAAEFPMVLRGYDRQQVDARLGELGELLAQERQQRAEAEQALDRLRQGNAPAVLEPSAVSFAGLGTRAAKVFEEAGAVAERLIEEGRAQARAIVDAAQAEVAQRLAAAEEKADKIQQAAAATLEEAKAERARTEAEAAEASEELLAAAERDAKAERVAARQEIRAARQQAERDRQLVEAQTQRLQTLRELLGEELGQVHNYLGLALRVIGEDPEADLIEDEAELEVAAEEAEPPAPTWGTETEEEAQDEGGVR